MNRCHEDYPTAHLEGLLMIGVYFVLKIAVRRVVQGHSRDA